MTLTLATTLSLLALAGCSSEPERVNADGVNGRHAESQPAGRSDSSDGQAVSSPDAADELATEDGKMAFVQCAVCHTVEQGAPARIGPNLFGVFGKEAGRQPGFAYSPALKTSQIVWDETSLDAFVRQPQAFVPGTRMIFPGVADEAKRKLIIEYLENLR